MIQEQARVVPGASVAVVDDVDSDAYATEDVLVDAGFKPVRIPLSAGRDLNDLLDEVERRGVALVCDHRLNLAQVPFDGARVVAASRERRIPAILVTAYAQMDADSSIRRWRAQIPGVIKRGLENTPEALATALQSAENETLFSQYNRRRQPYKTLVRVTAPGAYDEGAEKVVEVVIPAWRPDEPIQLPLSLIQETVPLDDDESLTGRRFVADVNIHAADYAELYCTNFEGIPEPPVDWMA